MAHRDPDYVQLLKDSFEAGAKSENLVPLVVASLLVTLGSFTVVLFGPLFHGFLKMAVAVTRGQKVQAGDVWPGTEEAIKAFILFLIIGIGVVIGSILLVLPGIIFAFFTGLAPYVLATEGGSAIDALKRSVELVKSNVVVVLVGGLIGAVIVGVGSIIPLAGTILLMPFAVLFMAKVYEHVRALPSGAASGELPSGR